MEALESNSGVEWQEASLKVASLLGWTHEKPVCGLARQYRRLLAHYYRLQIPEDARVLEIGCGTGEIIGELSGRERYGIEISDSLLALARKRHPQVRFLHPHDLLEVGSEPFDFILISDRLNYCHDVQVMLEAVQAFAGPRTRLVINSYNTLWRPLLSLATRLGIREPSASSNWLSKEDVANLLHLAGWEVVKMNCRILWPVETPLVERLVNRWLAPLLPFACLSIFSVSRPRPVRQPVEPMSVSVVVPARNEAGNIEAAVMRTQCMGRWTELIFVEGGSQDDTWAEIQRVKAAFPERRIKAFQQSASGKGNAVREGFAAAEGELLMILDADLTMPPEELPKFYEAVARNLGEFANGCRLVYPMESRAMRFLNMMANKFFGVSFSWLLGQHVKDTLCGTKVLRKSDYERIASNRAYFGDFDPFGDFDLLFGADKLNLKIVDIPIHYADRTYGSTNIDRWRHGALLFRMLGFAAMKVKFV